MPTARIDFHVLDVGQGSCNYVEIFDEHDAVTHNLLIDLGTNSRQAIAADNLEWLRQQIIANNHYLDVMILTHGDTDHYNLVAKILPAFGPPAGNQIGMVRYGGPAWRYKKGRLINILKAYAVPILGVPNVGGLLASQTGYSAMTDPVWTPIWSAGADATEPMLQLILANTPHDHDPLDLTKRQAMNPEAVNTKSVITALEWDGFWIVATGDATSTTLAAVNNLLAMVETAELPKTFMLTLPHHGSRKTTYDLRNANIVPGDDARKVIDDFLGKFPPRAMSISAGEKNHHHPSMYMIDQFVDNIVLREPYWTDDELQNDEHFLTSWIDLRMTRDTVNPAWPLAWQYASTRTKANIYCTLYFKDAQYNAVAYEQYLAPPVPVPVAVQDHTNITDAPLGRNWQFTMTADSFSVDSSENAARALAARAEFAGSPVAAAPAAFATAAGRQARAMGMGASAERPAGAWPAWARPAARTAAGPGGGRLRALRPIQ
ncbi:MAG: hypothetical protein QOD42_711 [Sphingomonadales bacterium]|jgi:hypothetical protein|nr:hypothetical protein [Sphingomonadales bacterium]